MTASLKTVEAAAMQLTANERAELIERLIDTVVPPAPLPPSVITVATPPAPPVVVPVVPVVAPVEAPPQKYQAPVRQPKPERN